MSNSIYAKRAKKVMPGGVNSPVRAFNGVGAEPFTVSRAKGDKIIDSDGNSYIDFVCSFGPSILGHSDDRVTKKLHRAIDNGLTYAVTCESEIKLAEMLADAVDCADTVRLVNSGTEAVMSAVRLARGYTGKKYIVKFNGCYHGHSDCLLVKGGSGLLTHSIPNSSGVLPDFTRYTLVGEYNDCESVKKLFDSFGDDIAAVIVEPVAANMGVLPPKKGFLEFLREITKKHNSLLIFDEVITGFRLGYGGAQAYFGIKPDIATLGKIIGGGLPVGAYCGKREIMSCVSPLGSVYQAGTLSGNPVTVAAGLATLEILRDNLNIYDEISEKAERTAAEFNKAFEGRARANVIGSMLTFFFNPDRVECFADVEKCNSDGFADFFKFMLNKGFYIPPSQFESMFISAAHTDEDIESFISAFKEYASGI